MMPGATSEFIAVHVGVGNHCNDNYPVYKFYMKTACRKAQHVLRTGGSATDAVTVAIKELEKCPLTNAGFGSCLTTKGTVECDAGIMDGSTMLHGAVGSVAGVRHPITFAQRIMQESGQRATANMLPPTLLVGQGAFKWGKSRGLETCDPTDLISDESSLNHRRLSRNLRKRKRLHNKEKAQLQLLLREQKEQQKVVLTEQQERELGDKQGCSTRQQSSLVCSAVDGAALQTTATASSDGSPSGVADEVGMLPRAVALTGSNAPVGGECSLLDRRLQAAAMAGCSGVGRQQQRQRGHSQQHEESSARLDTVGAVVVGPGGQTAAGCSSGGIIMKVPGRVGQSALLGAGFYAEDDCQGSGINVACCTTGRGEQLVATQLAAAAARLVATTEHDHLLDRLPQELRAAFMESKMLRYHHVSKICGGLLLRHDPAEGSTDLYCFLTGQKMGYAFLGGDSSTVKTMFSSAPTDQPQDPMVLDFHSYYPRLPPAISSTSPTFSCRQDTNSNYDRETDSTNAAMLMDCSTTLSTSGCSQTTSEKQLLSLDSIRSSSSYPTEVEDGNQSTGQISSASFSTSASSLAAECEAIVLHPGSSLNNGVS